MAYIWLISRQMAHEVHHALQISHTIVNLHQTSPRRLWHPHFSLAWFGVAPRTFILDERSTLVAEEIPDIDTNLSPEEARQGLAEHYGVANIPSSISLSIPIAEKSDPGPGRKYSYRFSVRQFHLVIPWVWRARGVLRIRLGLSKVVRAILHSSHLRHALKNAAGVALLSLPAFLPPESRGMHAIFAIGFHVLMKNMYDRSEVV